MKICFFGDVHCAIRKEFDEPSDRTGSSRLDKVLDTLDYIRVYCVENGVTHAVCTGDLFHIRGKIDVKVFNAVYQEIIKFSESDITVVLVAGNHDEINNSDTLESSLRTMGLIPGVHIIEDSYSLCVHDNVWLHCVPYSKDTKSMCEFINRDFSTENTNILVAHLGVSGATVGASSYPMQDAFSLEDLRPDFYKYVALGHYHDQQFVGGTNNVFYTGSPIAHDFGDTGQKGFMVVDTSKRWDIQFVEIPNPKFITISGAQATTQELEEHATQGNYLRVILSEDQVDAFTSMVPDNLKYRVELQREFRCEQRVDIQVGMNFNEVITRYAKEYMPEALDTGLKILAEVESI